MDVEKGRVNVIIAIVFKIITMIMAIVVKITLVGICGNEVNGLNALYISIIGVLSVAELGVGSAITFCMYKPIVNGDINTVSALYDLFRKLYLIIGAVIFFSGIAITPFLHFFAKDYSNININMYVTFVLVLISVSATYLFSAKLSLINAYKNDYISTAITQGGAVLQYVLQIITLYVTKSFVYYLICRIIAVIFQWLVTEYLTNKNYGLIINNKVNLNKETKHIVTNSIKAMFLHKIGYVLVNTLDSIIISSFVGVVSLGKYSNYTLIISSMTGIITLVFTSLTSVIGHLCVEESRQNSMRYCEVFHLLNFIIGTFFFLGYYAVVDSLIEMLFSAKSIVESSISFVITLNGFIQFMRRSILTFRDATGAFYQDRWKPILEGVLNATLSILLVKVIGVTGVIVATIATNLLICHIIEPFVLYKYVFSYSPKKFYLTNYGMITLFTFALVALNSCKQNISNIFVELVLNGFISLGISAVICVVILLICKEKTMQLLKIMRKG